MKPTWEWDEHDILGLIRDGVKESIDLDYKECPSLENSDARKNEVSKDVSAFANSAGGTIVYGVLENGHLPVAIDSGYDPTDVTKEWLEQVINSRIQRRIDGVRINQVELRQTAPGKVIYVVSIPQSSRAPHMAYDHKYYKRFNFASVPMEEYEVRDVALRDETPDLRIEFSLAAAILEFGEGETYAKPISLKSTIRNEAAAPAEFAVIRVYVDSKIRVIETGEFQHGGILSSEVAGTHYDVAAFHLNWGRGKMPLWEGVSFTISGISMHISMPKEAGSYVLISQVHSPRMSSKQWVNLLHSDGSKVTLQSDMP